MTVCLRTVPTGTVEPQEVSARRVSRAKIDKQLLTLIVQMRKIGPKKEQEWPEVTQRAEDWTGLDPISPGPFPSTPQVCSEVSAPTSLLKTASLDQPV